LRFTIQSDSTTTTINVTYAYAYAYVYPDPVPAYSSDGKQAIKRAALAAAY
jgi:hypothetical protein